MILYIVRPSLLFVIFFYRRFIQVITFCVNYYNRRKVLYGQFTDSFCSKIIICNDLRGSNCAGQKCSCTTYGCKVYRSVSYNGIPDFL